MQYIHGGLCCCLCVAAAVQLEVFPGEELRVVNTNEVDNDDYASVFDGVAAGETLNSVAAQLQSMCCFL